MKIPFSDSYLGLDSPPNYSLLSAAALIATGLHLDYVFTLFPWMRFSFGPLLLPTCSGFYGRKTEYTEAKKNPTATSS